MRNLLLTYIHALEANYILATGHYISMYFTQPESHT